MATIAWEEIKAHNTEADTWIVVHGNGKIPHLLSFETWTLTLLSLQRYQVPGRSSGRKRDHSRGSGPRCD